ncbi:hypothetical protein HYC85_023908 [Camellia sinensis]|uniref:peroxidase n=1 Tax=Camellia sinensis TaxID=4442 RepID=A0A7J7GFU7_CAMSI|nr:hypothetical protein HYC85_023908 [Camellia sinensis]
MNLNHIAKAAVTGGGNRQNRYVTALRNGCGRFLKPCLSGSHTIGQAQCFTFRNRIYDNGSNIDALLAPSAVVALPLPAKKGLLPSDQVLFNGGSTDNIVLEYSKNPSTFNSDFALAMIKMGDIKPLTGQDGVIRRICSALN